MADLPQRQISPLWGQVQDKMDALVGGAAMLPIDVVQGTYNSLQNAYSSMNTWLNPNSQKWMPQGSETGRQATPQGIFPSVIPQGIQNLKENNPYTWDLGGWLRGFGLSKQLRDRTQKETRTLSRDKTPPYEVLMKRQKRSDKEYAEEKKKIKRMNNRERIEYTLTQSRNKKRNRLREQRRENILNTPPTRIRDASETWRI